MNCINLLLSIEDILKLFYNYTLYCIKIQYLLLLYKKTQLQRYSEPYHKTAVLKKHSNRCLMQAFLLNNDKEGLT